MSNSLDQGIDKLREINIAHETSKVQRKRRLQRINAIEQAHRSFYNYFNEHHATPESAQLLSKVIGQLRDTIREIG